MAEKRVVERARAEALAAEYGLQYMETSAKAKINVDEAFIKLARDIKARVVDGNLNIGSTQTGGVKLEQQQEGGAFDKFRSACCNTQ